ncbi:hypothetical protein F5B20DRAFT_554661 [Whalleya microplaca]|nr:hypothetical protein F5B20DRAFT_554661 [Whalleya microplaca]
MKSFLLVTATLHLALHSLAQTALDIDSLFDIDLDSNNQGGCGYIGRNNMQNLLQESLDLGLVGVRLVADYRNGVVEARRLLDSFFKTTTGSLPEAELDAISNKYNGVSDWIQNDGAIDGGRSNLPPWLFCYHTWLLRRSMSDSAWNYDQEEYKDNNGNTVLINSVQDYLTKQLTESTEAERPLNQIYPYWSYMHREYFFDRFYASGANGGFCSLRRMGSLAATQHKTATSTITLCPMSFGATNNFEGATIIRRRDVAPNPIARDLVTSNQVPNGAQTLKEVLPTSITLFHELFHLVLGNDVTMSAVGEVYEIFDNRPGFEQIIGLEYANAVDNPESYALAAAAYDYTVNWDVDGQNPIEFYAGWTTQG